MEKKEKMVSKQACGEDSTTFSAAYYSSHLAYL